MSDNSSSGKLKFNYYIKGDKSLMEINEAKGKLGMKFSSKNGIPMAKKIVTIGQDSYNYSFKNNEQFALKTPIVIKNSKGKNLLTFSSSTTNTMNFNDWRELYLNPNYTPKFLNQKEQVNNYKCRMVRLKESDSSTVDVCLSDKFAIPVYVSTTITNGNQPSKTDVYISNIRINQVEDYKFELPEKIVTSSISYNKFKKLLNQ